MKRSAANYRPALGSVAEKALAYLRAQPPGCEVRSSVLADACGTLTSHLGAQLSRPLSIGLVFRRSHGGGMWWSVVDHSRLDGAVRKPAARRPRPSVVDKDAPTWSNSGVDLAQAWGMRIKQEDST